MCINVELQSEHSSISHGDTVSVAIDTLIPAPLKAIFVYARSVGFVFLPTVIRIPQYNNVSNRAAVQKKIDFIRQHAVEACAKRGSENVSYGAKTITRLLNNTDPIATRDLM